jgi:hypothetical protein
MSMYGRYWAHSKVSNRFPYAIPGHDLHYDFDTLEWKKTQEEGRGVIHFPLFTCLVYLNNGALAGSVATAICTTGGEI